MKKISVYVYFREICPYLSDAKCGEDFLSSLLDFPVSDNNHHVELFSGFFRLFKSTHSKNFLLEPILFIMETDIDIFEFLVFGYIHEGYSPLCAFISASLSAGWR